MLPGQPQLEGSGPGRGNTDTTGRGLRGRCPRETAGATSRRGIQKCRGKRKNPGKISSRVPLGFGLPVPGLFSLRQNPERAGAPQALLAVSPLVCIHARTHTHIDTHTYR